MNNKILIIFAMLLCCGFTLNAQITIGSGGFHIKSGAVVVLNGLHLQPSEDIHIKNNVMRVSNTPIPGNPHESIAQVYQWDKVITTKGLTGIYVGPSKLNGNSLSQLQLAYNATNSTDNFVVSTNSAVISTNNFVFETFPVTVWQQLTAVERGSVLPLQLLSFTGKELNNSIQLKWSVANEERIKDYTVLRSGDARQFSALDIVVATCKGCGVNTNYGYNDQQPLAGFNFYKLLITDESGKQSYSDVVKLQFASENMKISLSPNPAKNLVMISGLKVSGIYNLQVLASDGKVVYVAKISNKGTSYEINISNWANGIYFVRLTNKQGAVYQQKIVKQ